MTEAGMATLAGGCVPFMEGPMLQTKCWSGTGGVSRLWRGQQTRIASDLPSSYIVQSGFTSGPQDLSVAGGHLFVTLGVLAEDKSRFVADAGGNSLLEVGANGRISVTKATLCHRLCRSVTANGA